MSLISVQEVPPPESKRLSSRFSPHPPFCTDDLISLFHKDSIFFDCQPPFCFFSIFFSFIIIPGKSPNLVVPTFLKPFFL